MTFNFRFFQTAFYVVFVAYCWGDMQTIYITHRKVRCREQISSTNDTEQFISSSTRANEISCIPPPNVSFVCGRDREYHIAPIGWLLMIIIRRKKHEIGSHYS